MHHAIRRLSLLSGLALTVASMSALQAGAAPPTRVTESMVSVFCNATTPDGARLTVSVQTSSVQKVSLATADLAADGQIVAEGEGESSWANSSFSATIAMYTRPVVEDPGGHLAEDEVPVYLGDLAVAGSYRPAGDPVTYPVKGRDGNIHFDQSNTQTPLAVEVRTLAFGDTEFTDVTCQGESLEGRLTYTNPHTVVQRYDDLTWDCTAVNASPYPYIERVDEGWYVDVGSPDWRTSASGVIDFGRSGTWSGDFRVGDDQGSTRTVPASATLDRQKRPYHVTNGTTGMRDHAQITVYRMQLTVALPDQEGPAQLDCTINEAAVTTRQVNTAPPPGTAARSTTAA